MTAPEFAVRAERAGDRARVYEIVVAAFERSAEADLVERMRRCARPHLSLVAEGDGRLLGHVFFSPVQVGTAGESPPAAALAPVAVDPPVQGRGVGSALVRAGLARCSGLGWEAVFLVGSPSYYGRFGFELASPLGFSYGSPAFDPILQVCALRPGALEGLSGQVRFHPAFAETGTG